jgi:hypothetical protein
MLESRTRLMSTFTRVGCSGSVSVVVYIYEKLNSKYADFIVNNLFVFILSIKKSKMRVYIKRTSEIIV